MAQPKKGDRVRVTYEGVVEYVDELQRFYAVKSQRLGLWQQNVYPDSVTSIEVLEEPYEEGAIYESVTGGKFLYSPQADAKKPWVFIYFDGYLGDGSEIGDRFNRIMGARKLAPVE